MGFEWMVTVLVFIYYEDVKNKKSNTKTQNLTVYPGGKLNNFLNTFPERLTKFRTSKNRKILNY